MVASKKEASKKEMTPDVMVWSPTHTERWLLCPMLESYVQQGMLGQRERWSPGQIVGTAIHAGLRTHLTAIGNPEVDTIFSLQADWPRTGEADEWNQDEVIDKTVTCVRRLISDRVPSLFDDEGRIVAVELPLGDDPEGRGQYPGTPDLVTEHGPPVERYLAVVDWKSHWSLDDRFVERELVETEHNWQLRQYAYFSRKQYGQPVRYIRKCVVRVHPYRSWLYTAEVTEKALDTWCEQAKIVWWQMRPEGLVWQNWKNCRRYGRCEFYDRCHGEKSS